MRVWARTADLTGHTSHTGNTTHTLPAFQRCGPPRASPSRQTAPVSGVIAPGPFASHLLGGA
jgi:hypothetical protein